MNKSLFGITEELLQIFENIEIDEETGELLNLDAYEQINEDFETKASNWGLYIQQLQAEAKAIQEKEKELYSRRKAKENKADRMKRDMAKQLARVGRKSIETDSVRFTTRKDISTEILDQSLIPEEYLNTKLVINPDRTEIKKAIQSGADIPGARLVERQSIQFYSSRSVKWAIF